MLKPVEIHRELSRERKRVRSSEDLLLMEANRLLLEEQFHERNILSNLKSYNKSFGFLNETEADPELIYSLREIRSICIRYRLRFLDSQAYTGEFPYEALLKIKDLNTVQRKNLVSFKILTTPGCMKDPAKDENALLFCETVHGNFYLVHRWGKALPAKRKWLSFPLRNPESLMFCILFFAALVTLLLPNKYLTTDARAGYFSMYRIACFFHVLILVAGFSIFYLFGRGKNLSSSDWDNPGIR